jgi:hypothetical protein
MHLRLGAGAEAISKFRVALVSFAALPQRWRSLCHWATHLLGPAPVAGFV